MRTKTQPGRLKDESEQHSIILGSSPWPLWSRWWAKHWIALLLITASAATTPTADTLNGLLIFQLSLGNTTNACWIEIGFLGLNAAETAELEVWREMSVNQRSYVEAQCAMPRKEKWYLQNIEKIMIKTPSHGFECQGINSPSRNPVFSISQSGWHRHSCSSKASRIIVLKWLPFHNIDRRCILSLGVRRRQGQSWGHQKRRFISNFWNENCLERLPKAADERGKPANLFRRPASLAPQCLRVPSTSARAHLSYCEKARRGKGDCLSLTLVTNLKDWPENFMFLLALMRRILRILHFIAEFQQSIFDIIEPSWWGFAIASCRANGWHGDRKEVAGEDREKWGIMIPSTEIFKKRTKAP